MMTKDQVIKALGLKPLLNEGGFVNEYHRGPYVNGRQTYGTIYYLLTPNCCSTMHKLDADEVWFYHDGPALEMLLIYEDHEELRYLGNDILNGEEPQIVIPAGVWQGSHMKEDGEYTLVSTSMTPAYTLEGFEAGDYEKLKDRTENKELLKLLCGKPRYE